MSRSNLTEQDIQFIMSNTDFTREKIVTWHEDFLKQCPDGKLRKPEFVKFYKNLIPGDQSPDEDSYCEMVFQAFDADNNNYIDYPEFLISFWIRAKGSLRDKIDWLFNIYDTDRSNYLSQIELYRMFRLLFSVKNIKDDPYEKTKSLFDAVDRSKDNRITRQEFIAGLTNDENLRNLFAPF